jgi:hypothetical protein
MWRVRQAYRGLVVDHFRLFHKRWHSAWHGLRGHMAGRWARVPSRELGRLGKRCSWSCCRVYNIGVRRAWGRRWNLCLIRYFDHLRNRNSNGGRLSYKRCHDRTRSETRITAICVFLGQVARLSSNGRLGVLLRNGILPAAFEPLSPEAGLAVPQTLQQAKAEPAAVGPEDSVLERSLGKVLVHLQDMLKHEGLGRIVLLVENKISPYRRRAFLVQRLGVHAHSDGICGRVGLSA